jgi:hypothetical protein
MSLVPRRICAARFGRLWACRRWPALALLLAAGCGRSTAPEPAPADPVPGYRFVRIGGALIAASEAEARLHETLEQPLEVTLHFDKTPLDAALQYIGDTHDVSIVLDRAKLDNEAAGSEAPVTARLHGIKLRSALAALLSPLEATYVVRDDVIHVTSTAAEVTATRVYYVGDLIYSRHKVPDPNSLLGRPKPEPFFDPNAPDFDTLMELIRETSQPESWGGSGPYTEGMSPLPARDCLVIVQTEEVHRQICDLLGRLRALPRDQ